MTAISTAFGLVFDPTVLAVIMGSALFGMFVGRCQA
jgi:putative tricarboxylic transport membrane protein